ncbi:MAG: hypothetical protein ACRDTD_29935 [Pseudonocardiaceae bacterium]
MPHDAGSNAWPEPSAAATTTRPAMSLPGRQPGRGDWSNNVSPRLIEKASTATTASSFPGEGSSTSAKSTNLESEVGINASMIGSLGSVL